MGWENFAGFMSILIFLFLINLTVHSATKSIDTGNKNQCLVTKFYNLKLPTVNLEDRLRFEEYSKSLDDYFCADPVKCLKLVRKHWDYKFKDIFWMRNSFHLLVYYLGVNFNPFTLTMLEDIFDKISKEIQKRYMYMKLYDEESQSVNFKCIDVMISMVHNVKIEILKRSEYNEKKREELLFKIEESLKVWEFIGNNFSFDSEGGVNYHSFFDSFEKVRRSVIRKQDEDTETRSLCILFTIYSTIVRLNQCRKLFDFEDSERKPFVVYLLLNVFRIKPMYSVILDVSYFIYGDFKKILLEDTKGKLRLFREELQGPFYNYLITGEKLRGIHLRSLSYLCHFIDYLGDSGLAWELLALRELERFILTKSRMKTPSLLIYQT